MEGFYVQNFGCRATQADGADIERQFRDRGIAPARSPVDAQVVVLNTCTVTAAADRDARAAIRRIRRENSACQIIVTGCYAQRAPGELASLPGVSVVVGNSHKHQLVEIAAPSRPADGDPPVFVTDIFAHTQLLAAPVFEAGNDRTRPNLKVQDGCDNRCSFCVIPYVRGQSRSLPLDRVIDEVNVLVAGGYKEVVVSGINLGRWGRDLQPENLRQTFAPRPGRPVQPCFEDLIEAILDHTELEKLRISSVEPMDWSDRLIAQVAGSSRIARHAHVPLQSGSDRVLRAMHRKYRPWHYRRKIEKIHSAMPTAAIGADVMVGFPGETDTDFEETRRMVEDLPLTYLHVFTYSPRPGTPAASLGNQIPEPLARERNRILRELGEAKKLRFMRSFVGTTLQAITLSGGGIDCQGDFTEAVTDNYLKLRVRGRQESNRWIAAHVEGLQESTLTGSAKASQ